MLKVLVFSEVETDSHLHRQSKDSYRSRQRASRRSKPKGLPESRLKNIPRSVDRSIVLEGIPSPSFLRPAFGPEVCVLPRSRG